MTLKEKLMNVQAELKAPKNLRNNFGGYNYRNAESILEALKPLLVKYKATVTITDTIEVIGDRIYVKATATIYDVENKNNDADIIIATAYAREADSKKGMDDAQVTGATSSYARKYALNGLFLLDDTQDVDTEAYQKAEKSAQSALKAKNNKTTPKQESKPTEAKPEPAEVIPLTEEELLFLSSRYKGDNLTKLLEYYNIEDISQIGAEEGRNLIAMIKAKKGGNDGNK
jgi:hypothetical protein